jgi:hypothetical protein
MYVRGEAPERGSLFLLSSVLFALASFGSRGQSAMSVGKGRGGGRGRAGGRGARRGRGRGRGKNPGDIGCEPGDPNNRLLPWVPRDRETLPDASILGQTERLLENVTLPSFQSRPLRKCAIMVDRHVHKNGGSTVRDVFLEHERTGFALYQGYTQMYWHRDFKVMRRAAEDAVRTRRTPESVLLVEAHFGWVELAQAVLPSLRELERMYKRAGIDCPLVLMTRVREVRHAPRAAAEPSVPRPSARRRGTRSRGARGRHCGAASRDARRAGVGARRLHLRERRPVRR